MILAHNKTLIKELYEKISVFEKDIGYYLGGMKEKQLKESESKKIIIATYAMASEGLDIKTLTTLCMATPKSDVCQSIGRILRGTNTNPFVIDVIDDHDIFRQQLPLPILKKGYQEMKDVSVFLIDTFDIPYREENDIRHLFSKIDGPVVSYKEIEVYSFYIQEIFDDFRVSSHPGF